MDDSELSSFGTSTFKSKKFRMAASLLWIMTPSAAWPSLGTSFWHKEGKHATLS
jgi:hypothetical protein